MDITSIALGKPSLLSVRDASLIGRKIFDWKCFWSIDNEFHSGLWRFCEDCEDCMVVLLISNHPVMFASHAPCENRDIVSFGLCGWWPLLVSYDSVKLSCHRPWGSGNIVCKYSHVTTWLEGHTTFQFAAPIHKPSYFRVW